MVHDQQRTCPSEGIILHQFSRYVCYHQNVGRGGAYNTLNSRGNLVLLKKQFFCYSYHFEKPPTKSPPAVNKRTVSKKKKNVFM